MCVCTYVCVLGGLFDTSEESSGVPNNLCLQLRYSEYILNDTIDCFFKQKFHPCFYYQLEIFFQLENFDNPPRILSK